MKLDYKNKKILTLLIEDCRLTTSQIAKKINSSREVVAYRIGQLEKTGVIRGYTTDLNFEKLGYIWYSINLSLNSINSKKIASLRKRRRIPYLQESLGKYNLSCSILVQDFVEFKKEYNYIIDLFGKDIISVNSDILLGDVDFLDDFFIKKRGAKYRFRDDQKKISVDKIDKKILMELGLNARQSLVSISNRIRVSIPTISKKIKKLKKQKVILRNTVIIDYKKMGYYRYSLRIFANPKIEKSLVEFCSEYHQIWYFGKFSGSDNYVIEILSPDNAEFNSIINLLRQKFKKDISRYDILIATALYKGGEFYI